MMKTKVNFKQLKGVWREYALTTIVRLNDSHNVLPIYTLAGIEAAIKDQEQPYNPDTDFQFYMEKKGAEKKIYVEMRKIPYL